MYIVNGEVVDNIKAMEWAKNNTNTEFISLYEGIHKKFKYNNGYFISYIYGKDWNHISTYYKSLPSSIFEEQILFFCDEKQWCPIQ